MTKLEALPWIDGFVWTAHGVRVGVRVNDASLLPRLRERLPPGARMAKDGVVDRLLAVWSPQPLVSRRVRGYYVLYADHVRAGRSFELEPLLGHYDSHARIAIAQYARPQLFVHAGAVAWRGKGAIFPAPSLRGKSHLVAELVRAGATYYSDEYAVLDCQGMLHAFPKPISLRPHATARQRDVPVEALGRTVGTEPIPIELAVFCEYERGAGWRPQEMSPGRGLLALLANTFSARERPREALDILHRVASRALCVECRRDDAATIAGAVLSTIENSEGLKRWNRV
jgi:hypothetical protein